MTGRTASIAVAAAAALLVSACAQEAAPPPKPAAPASASAPAQAPAEASPPAQASAKSPASDPQCSQPAGAADPKCTRKAKPSDLFPPDPEAGKPIASPFGDPWDPTRDPPVAPETKGAGITSATIVAAGPADVKELPRPAGSAAVFYGAVVNVTIEAGSTTGVLGPESVTLAPANGEPAPLFAACMPTLEDASAVHAEAGTRIAAWTVSVGERTWKCGGGNARMIRQFSPGGFRLTAPAAGWSGPMVLLFEGQDAPPKSIALAGTTIGIPAAQSEKKNG